MKVLQVCAIDVTADALLVPFIKALRNEGNIVHTACSDTGMFFQDLQKQGFIMKEISMGRNLNPLANIRSIYKLYRLMVAEKYDVVHVHTPLASILARIAAKMAGVRTVIYTAHGFYFHQEMASFKYQICFWIEKIFTRFFTNWLLLVSHEDYQLSVSKRFLRKERIMHTMNGIDVDHLFNPARFDGCTRQEWRTALGFKKDDVVFVFIGRFVREKGIFAMYHAFQMLKKKHAHVKLMMVGDMLESERDKSYLHLKEDLKRDANILVTGYRKDIPELLSCSDVFVLPSHREGLPLCIMEAMAMEKPIIASDIRGCREEVISGENGYLVRKGSVNDLYEKMCLLTEDRDLRNRLGIKSRQIAQKRYRLQDVLMKQLQLYAHIQTELRGPCSTDQSVEDAHMQVGK